MVIKRTSHAVYDTRYQIVWAPKYRKWILRGDIRDFVEKCFAGIASSNKYETYIMEIAEDHVYIFLGFPLRYSISEVVQRLKGISAGEILKRYPEVTEELWGGEFWEDGYSVRTVGDKVTKDVIRRYIEYHNEHGKSPQKQLELF